LCPIIKRQSNKFSVDPTTLYKPNPLVSRYTKPNAFEVFAESSKKYGAKDMA
jgi:hypothetical protein